MVKSSSFDFDDFEPKLRKRVAQELSRTDFGHTLQVVKNIKRYLSMEGGKYDVLVAVAYLHEVGKGERTVLLSSQLEDLSPVMQRYYLTALKAKEVLLSLKFPAATAEEVARYLSRGECVELKRAHHTLY